jgi:hypothetical protein
MRRLLKIALLVLSATCSTPAQSQQDDPRELIQKARAAAELYGNHVWAGFSDAPFGILLVEEDRERLFCHQGLPDSFELTGVDPILSCPSSTRPASFPPNMLASFPAVDGVATIVIGTPEATGKSPDAWVLTILHEHFHQMQFAWPDYYPGTSDLGLSGGDETGMWMLNYPFPYDRGETVSAFRVMANRLIKARDARNTDAFYDALEGYWQAREAARRTVSEDDWRYIELQFWQEGVARWTEGAIAAFSDDLADAAGEANALINRELSTLDLSNQNRSAVYPIGAGEASLLEAGGSDWRTNYWSEPFSLGPQLRKLIDRLARHSAT